jgi:hypothetical protein
MRNLVKLQWGSKSNLGVYVGLVLAWTNKDDEKKQKKSYIIWIWAPQLLILDHPKTCFGSGHHSFLRQDSNIGLSYCKNIVKD